METYILKLKTKSGQSTLKLDKPLKTIAELKTELSKVTNILPSRLHVRKGFPPQVLDLEVETEKLEACGVYSGDALIIEEKNVPESPAPDTHSQIEGKSGVLLKQVVPADNSCLFTSIGFVLLGGTVDVTYGRYLREIIAKEVTNDQLNYNEAILGRPNEEYCKWILRPDSWGGAIELAVLSKFYGIEIAVVDTVNAIINRFGEDQLYENRVFLLFDGVHYDPLYLDLVKGDGSKKTVFPVTEDSILDEAKLIAVEAKTSRQFTDLNKFTLMCEVCKSYLKGQEEALLHAKETGHSTFGEVSR